MWCGGCYISDATLPFHVDSLGKDGENGEIDKTETERMKMVWATKLRDPTDFHVARKGDHLVTPFECDLCVFRKLRRTNPKKSNASDRLLLGLIRRMNLDAFWSRETSTVVSNANRAAMSIDHSRMLGLLGPYEDGGGCTLEDHCGYEVAANMLIHSRRAGRHSKNYTQFSAVRKLRSTFGNQVRASGATSSRPWTLVDEGGGYRRLVQDKCGSLWFNRFITGMQKRMGRIWKPNRALSVVQMKDLIRRGNERYEGSENEEDRNIWSSFLVYAALSYVLSLRGSEGFMFDLDSTNRHRDRNDGSYLTIGLMGKVKGETQDRCHLLPVVNITGSGINVKYLLDRHLALKRRQGLERGPGISNTKGEIMNSNEIDERLVELLEDMYDEDSTSFPAQVDSKEKISEGYHCFRTFRRTSDTQALNRGVSGDDIDVVNRWEKLEKTGRNDNMGPMKQHYAEFELLIDPFKRYGGSM